MVIRRILAVLFLCNIIIHAIEGQDERPNIIFILTDDQRWDALGYAGNEIIKTPEMDKLAEDGVYFKNAFVTTPICAASRASIMTGFYERKHQYTFQKPPLSKRFIDSSYFSILNAAGYYTGFLGKLGVKFEDRLDTTLFDYYVPESQSHYFKIIDGVHQHVTDCIGDRAVEFIEQAPKNSPFCLSISFHAPHAIDNSPIQYMWSPAVDAIADVTTIPAPLKQEDEYFKQLPDKVKMGFNRVRWKWRFDSPEKYQQMVKGYYNMINGIDINLGKIREALTANNVAQNTIIILMGDNGYFLGERQLAGKWLMYEPSLRVPLIIYNPKAQAKEDIDDLVLNIDIAPTILDIAQGAQVSSHGLSLLPFTEGKNSFDKERLFFLCEHLWNFEHIPASEGVRSRQFKYFRYIDDPKTEELYNIEEDPNELKNLVNDSDMQETLTRLREKCDQMIKESLK